MNNLSKMLSILSFSMLIGCGVAEGNVVPPAPKDVETCKDLDKYKDYEEMEKLVEGMKPCDDCLRKNGDPSKCGDFVISISYCLQNLAASVISRTDYRVKNAVVSKRTFDPTFRYGELSDGKTTCASGSKPSGCTGVVPVKFLCK